MSVYAAAPMARDWTDLFLTDGPNIKAIEFALVVITIGSTITTIQRILHVRAQAKRETSSLPTEQEQM